MCLAAALIGFAWAPLTHLQRSLLVLAAVLLVFPTVGLWLPALALAGGTLVWARRGRA